MHAFTLLGTDGDETRLLTAPTVGYSISLAGHPHVVPAPPGPAKYDIVIALRDVAVTHGFRISDLASGFDPRALATSLVEAYRNQLAQDKTAAIEPLALAYPDVLAGAHTIYSRKGMTPAVTEHVWVMMHKAPAGYHALFHTSWFETERVTNEAWAQLRASFIDQHRWTGDPRDAAPVALGYRTERSAQDERSHSRTVMQPAKVTFEYGNPHAPIGIGGFTIHLDTDGSVQLIHEKPKLRREWRARALPALWSALAASPFPRPAPPQSVAAGTPSHSLTITRTGGSPETVRGPGSAEYAPVSKTFMMLVAQLSGAAVLGFALPTETAWVADVTGPM